MTCLQSTRRGTAMQIIDFDKVELGSGYWFEKEKLNREVTIGAVYDQFAKSGRIKAFDFDWTEGTEGKPHIFWDSDVAKWMEGAAYILAKSPDAVLEARLDTLIEKIRQHQCADGYFNIYYTVVEPNGRFTDRSRHELYCAGHLIEAAIACDLIGKPVLLECMKKYVDYIYRVFVEERTAAFATPGHEEIELALLRLYRHTGGRRYLELAAHFINTRGTSGDFPKNEAYNQSHLPVREQREAVGHAVRAVYLYTGMAMLARETGDTELLSACRALFDDITGRKMYVSGGIGSTRIGEAFTNAYDLPNDTSYAETCASIAMMFFCRAMLENEDDARYADVIEREVYNGVLSGLSLDGRRFFYENALEINLNEHFIGDRGKPRFPITQRPEIFGCSCCPPNINRLLPSLGGYIFGRGEGVLYINQYTSASLADGGISCAVKTDYPNEGRISVTVSGVGTVALRIPGWCDLFSLNKEYDMRSGYAYVKVDGEPIELGLSLTPRAVFASSDVARDAYRLCVMRGPVLYCAEGIDNAYGLHRYSIAPGFNYCECRSSVASGLMELDVDAQVLVCEGDLYTSRAPSKDSAILHMIPYNAFANRGETDMRVWFAAGI